MIRWLLALVLAATAVPLAAQPAASPALRTAADLLVAMLRTSKVDAAAFSPAFLAQVPVAQVETVATQLRKANGAVTGLASLTAEGAEQGLVAIDYADAVVTARIVIEPEAPHRFLGLLITGVERRGDSFGALIGDLRKLRGTTALGVARLGAASPVLIAAHNADTALATGSVFKLFVLAELARVTTVNARSWRDVVALGPSSLPSGVTQTWPTALPVTLATLATQMISISDNTAADTLMATLGRSSIDAMRASVGTSPGALPVLTTLEAFALKMPAQAPLRTRWTDGDIAARRQVLRRLAPTVAAVDPSLLAGKPLHIDTVEWPATMSEIVGILDVLRRSGSTTAFDILGINPALPPAARQRFERVGYKGGSETGVIAMSWLLKTRSGEWYAVAGAWNDAAEAVDTAQFSSLMTRAVALVGK